jgi:hypothetical protein
MHKHNKTRIQLVGRQIGLLKLEMSARIIYL